MEATAASAAAPAPSTADRMSMSLDDCIKVRRTETRKPKSDEATKPAKAAKKKKGGEGAASKKKSEAEGQSGGGRPAKGGGAGVSGNGNGVVNGVGGGGRVAKKPVALSRSARRKAARRDAASAAGSIATGGVSGTPAGQPTRSAARVVTATPARTSSTQAGCRVSVSNLNTGVSEEDIRELFGAVGRVVSAVVKIELRNGRSERSADVVFEQMSHALEAINRYNNVPLDDMPLRISLSTTRGARSRPAPHAHGRRSGNK